MSSRKLIVSAATAAILSLLAACSTAHAKPAAAPRVVPPGLNPAQRPDPFASTYQPASAPAVAIINATVLTATGPRIDGGAVLIRDGKIAAVGHELAIPEGTRVIDAAGRWVTPGIIDPHAHIGSGSSPGAANGEGRNATGGPAGGGGGRGVSAPAGAVGGGRAFCSPSPP